ncbi:MAG: protein kinase [Acidobacteriota bacterium]
MAFALRTGDSLSHFRIVAPLGSGGMGEVYKAMDDSLERLVALKILPNELVRNSERLRRFVQEAKSASSLSHPNIVHIYEIGEAVPSSGDGQAAGNPLYFIAMELIDGRTLKGEIHEEHAELRTLVGWLAQVADGLAKAHAAGIVHRDLKPDNVMITRDGFAKVLDFGLAKLTEKRNAAGETNAPTAVRERTREGAVMGTIGYMSPEQVQGKSVDHRSDIFSFGCILYEAATRTRPFDGDSDVDVLHKILHDKPQPVDELNPNVPTELRRVIRRCLAKDVDRRYQSMKDLSIELAEVVEEWDELSVSISSGSHSLPVVPGTAPRSWLLPGLLALLVLVGASLAYAVFRLVTSHRKEASAAFSTMKILPVTGSGDVVHTAISPDGRYIANVRLDRAGYGISVWQVSTGSNVQAVAPSPFEIFAITFSPDGDSIYFTRREEMVRGYSILFQVSTLGGTPRKIVYDVDSPPGFSPDGQRIVYERGNPPSGEGYVMTAKLDGSDERKLATLRYPKRFGNVAAKWSPDGKQIAIFTLDSALPIGRLVLIDSATGSLTELGTSTFWFPSGLAWVPEGDALLVAGGSAEVSRRSGQIWSVSVPSGDLTRVTNDLSDYQGCSLTRDGKTLSTSERVQNSELWFWTPGSPEPTQVSQTKGTYVADITTSNTNIYYMALVPGGNPEIWTANLDGSGNARLISGDAEVWAPSAPADGSFVAFQSRAGGRARVWRAERDGSNPRPITDSLDGRQSGSDVTADGQFLLYIPANSDDLIRMPLAGSGKSEVVVKGVGGPPSASPDGKRVAVQVWASSPSDRELRKLIVVPVSGGAPEVTLKPDGQQYGWTPDGKALTFIRDDENVSNLWRQPLDGSKPEQLTHFRSGLIFSYAWTPSGKLVMGRGEIRSDAVLIRNFR